MTWWGDFQVEEGECVNEGEEGDAECDGLEQPWREKMAAVSWTFLHQCFSP